MKSLSFVQTSVFVQEGSIFSGNQLATFYNPEETKNLSQYEMQGIAREINFSETTFIVNDLPFPKVRIFTPAQELKFAGHPTLGTAYVLREKKLIPENKSSIQLELGIGLIDVEFQNEKISMVQPKPELLDQFDNYFHLGKALNLQRSDFSSVFPMQYVSTGLPYLLVPIESLKAIKKVQIDIDALNSLLEEYPSKDVLLFSLQTEKNGHVHVRMFAPTMGVIEDPATGSAAGPLAAYLEHYEVLVNHNKGSNIEIEQGFEIGRPSRLTANVLYENNVITGVKVSGQVKLVAEGTYYI